MEPAKPAPVCANCNKSKDEHFAVYFAGGRMISGVVLVCPRATWIEANRASEAKKGLKL